MTKARELAELSRTIIDTSDATAITINANEEVTLADDLFLADGKKAVFGAGSDLQIYHDGSHSRIVDSGTGILTIQASSQLGIYNADGTEVSAEFVSDGKVGLRFNGSEKLATTSSGVQITGTLSATGVLTVIDGSTSAPSISNAGDSNTGIYFPADDQLGLLAGGSRKLHVTSSGVDIENGSLTGVNATFSGSLTVGGSLNGISTTQSVSGNRWGVLPEVASNGVMEIGRYIDFHTTDGDTSDYGARFDYDGSKMILTSDFQGSGTIRGTRLGGNADPNANYAVNALQNGSMTHAGYFQANGDDIGVEIKATASSYSSTALLVQQSTVSSGGFLARFANGSGNQVTIGTDGKVGIGESVPLGHLHIKDGDSGMGSVNANFDKLVLEDSSHSGMTILGGANTHGAIYFADPDTNDVGQIKYQHNDDSLAFTTNSVLRMVIDSGGKIHSHYGIHINPNSTNNHVYHQINRTSGHDGHLVFLQSQTPQWQQVTDSSHHLNFYSYQNGAGTQVRFESTGDVALLDGDLRVASGHGINFSANANASGMTSETLSDYEEGTWTPTLTNGGSIIVQGAHYTKIGRQVFVQGYIQNITPTANTSAFIIGGLPFSGISSNSYTAGAISYIGTSSADASALGLLPSPNANYLYFHFVDGSTGSQINNNNWIAFFGSGSGKHLIFTTTYFST